MLWIYIVIGVAFFLSLGIGLSKLEDVRRKRELRERLYSLSSRSRKRKIR